MVDTFQISLKTVEEGGVHVIDIGSDASLILPNILTPLVETFDASPTKIIESKIKGLNHYQVAN